MQEPLADGRVVAVADRGHHVPAIVAEVLHGLLARDVSLVRHEDREDEDERADDQGDHPALETSLGLEREGGPRGGHGGSMRPVVKYPWVGKSSVSGIPNDRRDPISPRAPTGRKGFSMWPTARTIAILLTLGLASGAAALGVNAFLSSSGDAGSDHGLDTDGDGRFDWLVVEAQVVLPEAGTWDVYASLSAESASASSCGSWYRQPLPVMETGPLSVPIASTYERYFFPSGAQSVRMAFDGEDIVRAEADGPYVVQASLTLGGWIAYADTRPFGGPAFGGGGEGAGQIQPQRHAVTGGIDLGGAHVHRIRIPRREPDDVRQLRVPPIPRRPDPPGGHRWAVELHPHPVRALRSDGPSPPAGTVRWDHPTGTHGDPRDSLRHHVRVSRSGLRRDHGAASLHGTIRGGHAGPGRRRASRRPRRPSGGRGLPDGRLRSRGGPPRTVLDDRRPDVWTDVARRRRELDRVRLRGIRHPCGPGRRPVRGDPLHHALRGGKLSADPG